VFTDIPYNCQVQGHVTGSSAHGEFVMASGELSDDAFAEFMAKSLMRISETLMPGGVAYFCIDWRNADKVFDGVKPTDLEMMNLVVWDKGSGGMGSWYRSRHELIFVLRKDGDGHLNRVELGKHGRDRHNVWCYPGVNGFGSEKAKARDMHPTVKPLNLVRDAILDCSARGDLIVDLFSGSGTTIAAAHNSGRRGAAIDLDPRYVDTGVVRWQDISGKEAVLAATGQTFREVRAERAAAADTTPALPPARQRVRKPV
jgi:DNA modification methylase